VGVNEHPIGFNWPGPCGYLDNGVSLKILGLRNLKKIGGGGDNDTYRVNCHSIIRGVKKKDNDVSQETRLSRP